MTRPRRLRRALLALAVLAAGVVLALRTERAASLLCGQLKERLPQALGGSVAIARCEVDPLVATVEVHGFSLTLEGATAPAVVADKALVSIRGLFAGGVALQDVRLVRPQVTLEVPAPAPPPPGQEPAACPLDAIKRLRVGSLRIDDGRVHLTQGGKELRLDGLSVRASLGRRDGAVTLDARSGAIKADGGRVIRLGKLTLETEVDLDARAVEVQRAEANVEGVTASITAVIDALCGPSPSVTASGQLYVPMELLNRLKVPIEGGPSSGQLWARVSVDGHVDDPTVRLEVTTSQVKLGKFTPGDVTLKAVADRRRVILEELFTRAGAGHVRASGELSLKAPYPLTARVETVDASLANALERAGVTDSKVDFPASLKGTFTGQLAPPLAIAGDVDLRTGPFLLKNVPYHAPRAPDDTVLAFSSGQGSFRLVVTDTAITFEDCSVTAGPFRRSHVKGVVRLDYDARKGLDIAVEADHLDLADFGAIASFPWAGEGTARAHVYGTYEEVAIDAQATLRDFTFDGYAMGVVQAPMHFERNVLTFPSVVAQKGQTQYFGALELDLDRHHPHIRTSVQLPDGRVEDVVDVLADLNPDLLSGLQDGALRGRLSLLMAIDSPTRTMEGAIIARLREVDYAGRRLGDAQLVTRFEQGAALVLEPITFTGPLGVTRASGRWTFDGPLDFTIRLDGASTAELLNLAEEGVDVGGRFTLEADVSGDDEAVHITGALASDMVSLGGHRLGPAEIKGELKGRDFTASGTLFPGLAGSMDMLVKDEWPFDAALDVDLPSLKPFLPARLQSDGQVKGVLTLKGPWQDLAQVRAVAELPRVTVSRGDLSLSSVEPVELEYNAGAVLVRSLVMQGPTSQLWAMGRWGPTAVDLKSRGTIDLRLISSFTQLVERPAGRLDFTAAFTGSVKKPTLAGSATVADGRFSLPGRDLSVRGLTGRADFTEARVLARGVEAQLNDGKITVGADVKLAGTSMAGAQVQLDVSGVTTQLMPDVPATLSGSVQLGSTDAEAWVAQGSLTVDRLRYVRPLTLESFVSTASGELPSDERPQPWLKLNVEITPGDVRIDNNLARARVLGRLTLGGTNVKPTLTGAVELATGAQAYFRGNTFTVGRGLLQLGREGQTFELAAQAQVREYLVFVKGFGRLDDPKVTLSSEPAIPETDLLSLLTLGVTSRERLSERSGFGLAAEALMTASGLDQQVNRFLTQAVGLTQQQFRITSTFNELTGASEPAVSWEAKGLNDSLRVGVVQPFTGRGTKAQAEWRFNPRVSARAQWDNQNQNTTIGNPGVDLRFRFEWE